MATVPRIVAPTVEVRPTPFVPQSAEGATPDAFGAASARGMIRAGEQLGAFGEQVFRTAERIRYDEDQRAVTEAETEFAKRRLAVVRGDGTEQNPGFYGMNGQTAIDGYKTSREALDAARQEIATGIKSERARLMFEQRANRQIVAEDDNMIGHVTRQRTVAANAASEVKINTARSEIAQFYNDPERVAKQLQEIETEERARAARNGISDEATISGLLVVQRSAAVEGAVKAAMLGRDTKSAQQLFTLYQGQIDGRTQAVLGNMIRDKVIVEEAQAAADRIWAKAKANGWTEERAREEINKEMTGELRDATTKRVNEAFGTRDQDLGRAELARSRARTQQGQADEDKAIAEYYRLRDMPREERDKEIDKLGSSRTRLLVEDRLNSFFAREDAERRRLNAEAFTEVMDGVEQGRSPREVPADLWSRLSPAQRTTAERRFAAVNSGAPIVSEPGAREEYMTMPLAQLATEDLAVARMRLSPQHFKEIEDRAIKARNGENIPGLATRASDTTYISKQLSDLGFNRTTPSGRQARDSLFNLIDREIAVAREANEGRITDAERERIVRQAVSTYIQQPNSVAAFFGLGRPSENTEAARQAEGLSREQLRARQNAPVVNSLLAQAFPSDRLAPGAAAAVAVLVEDPSSRNFTPQQRQDMRVLLRNQGIASPTPYQITAALVYERDRADFQRGQ